MIRPLLLALLLAAPVMAQETPAWTGTPAAPAETAPAPTNAVPPPLPGPPNPAPVGPGLLVVLAAGGALAVRRLRRPAA